MRRTHACILHMLHTRKAHVGHLEKSLESLSFFLSFSLFLSFLLSFLFTAIHPHDPHHYHHHDDRLHPLTYPDLTTPLYYLSSIRLSSLSTNQPSLSLSLSLSWSTKQNHCHRCDSSCLRSLSHSSSFLFPFSLLLPFFLLLHFPSLRTLVIKKESGSKQPTPVHHTQT